MGQTSMMNTVARAISLIICCSVLTAAALASASARAGTFPGQNGRLLIGCSEGICLLDPDSNEKEVIFPVTGATGYALSPDGLRVAYQVGYDDGSGTNAEIWVGSIATKLGNKVADGFDPSWSPDGSSLVVWQYEPSGSEHNIYKVGVDDPGLTQLTQTGGDIAPVWGPDNRIAFSSVRDVHLESCPGGSQTANHEIYVMDADGITETNVTRTPGEDERVSSWFPSGDELIQVHDRDGSPCTPLDGELWRISVADGVQSDLIDSTNFCQYDGAVSPDRTRVAFLGATCPASGSSTVSLTLYVMDLPAPGSPASSGWQEVGRIGFFEWTPCAEGRCDLGEPAERQVGLTLKKHLVARGAIYSNEPDCMVGQTVKIQRKVSGAWKTIASATTRADGTFNKAVPDKPGTYRAKLPTTADCLSAKSIPSTHRH